MKPIIKEILQTQTRTLLLLIIGFLAWRKRRIPTSLKKMLEANTEPELEEPTAYKR